MIEQPPPKKPNRSSGPWLLKFVGVAGFGRHADTKIEDVQVIDLGRPPEDEDLVSAGSELAETMVFLTEEVEPEPGLRVPVQAQVIEPDPANGNCWRVVDV